MQWQNIQGFQPLRSHAMPGGWCPIKHNKYDRYECVIYRIHEYYRTMDNMGLHEEQIFIIENCPLKSWLVELSCLPFQTC
jgi:hypothetical protein